MNSEAGCTACSQPRVLKAFFPTTKGYELKIYECASCGSDLRLVTNVSKSSGRKAPKGRLPLSTRSKKPSRQRQGGPLVPQLLQS